MPNGESNLLYALLAAALTVGGLLIALRQQEKLKSRREETEALYEISGALLEFYAAVKRLGFYRAQTVIADKNQQALLPGEELVDSADNLSQLAMRFRLPENTELAVRLTRLAEEPLFRTDRNMKL